MSPDAEAKLEKFMGRVEEVLDKHVVYNDACGNRQNCIRSEVKGYLLLGFTLFGVLLGFLKWLG